MGPVEAPLGGQTILSEFFVFVVMVPCTPLRVFCHLSLLCHVLCVACRDFAMLKVICMQYIRSPSLQRSLDQRALANAGFNQYS